MSGVLYYISNHYNFGGDMFMVASLPALGGFASSIAAWKRHEPYWALWLIGLLLNLAPLIMVGALIFGAGSNC